MNSFISEQRGGRETGPQLLIYSRSTNYARYNILSCNNCDAHGKYDADTIKIMSVHAARYDARYDAVPDILDIVRSEK